ncbi:hypothetical protein HanRHA438_Chr09g0373051 [Helianthus annuus]|uniref:CDP-diacylglycerol-glycerol-3-phosphate 3-phosphatidyltransferase n=1 Tax=Helianthus annuus TaxID=4232 RepID=A0A251TRQ7_HELAN|nr:uncharacterized protein LOC110877023 [Helianthus annuus]KAF5788654.1 hypothetical protein HanXRQr2_Chr09g0361651 [Helianthus annuus]KAJ0524271.1 hypothetical protein HanHA300_Chr09g0298551 [Helianthus annuus]KAJ0531863.1 hypothetical protein HanIR_Chr09g0390301 [Helianthus annuus]KAJ0540465.1 hypothetical protein HanHA89_Chr09g0317141 [Helianthus annuus]KAJ0705615.1 hypothetical protein HanLR1_Chr09g0297401 [Helianthus annuus]
MSGNDPYGNSWADQWDHNPDPMPVSTKKTGGGIGKKVGDGFRKTKVVAATGAKKVKQGTSVGLRWIKDKYHKTTQKH